MEYIKNIQTGEKYFLHFDTPNASFIKMAVTLRKLGIENWHFFMKLYDERLVGVDPYSKNITPEEAAMVIRECERNRWYFYRELFRVGETGSSTEIGGGSRFLLNRGNLAYLWSTDLNLNTYMILPRQTGKTWAAIADCTWVHQFRRNSSIVHFNKTQTDSNENVARIKLAISMLPLYLQHSSDEVLEGSDKRKVKNNDKTLQNIIHSKIVAMSSASNESKADAMSRGRTAEKMWYDEIAFIFFNRTIYTASTPAYEKAKENAIKNKSPYGITITTTPGDLATPHGEYAYTFKNLCIPFTEDMYDWTLKKLFKFVYDSKGISNHMPYMFIECNYRQLGYTDEWYRHMYADMGDPLRARREYLLEWIDTNGNSPFDPDDVELIAEYSKNRAEKADTVKINKYFKINIYDKYRGDKPVLISCDVSGSVGRDSSSLVAINPETLMPLAIFRSNVITSKHFAKVIVKVATNIFPHSIITVENNSIGHPLIEELLDSPIRSKIYRERKTRTVDTGVNNFTRKQQRDVIEYGHNTNTITRPQMMDILESMVRYSPKHLGFPELYEEIRFLQLKNGRIDHGSATHDDVTMAYMGALWVVRYGKGLKGKGIYFNVNDGSDSSDDIPKEDYSYWNKVDKYVRKANNIQAENDDFIDYMTTEQPVVTTADLDRMQREEYLKELDRIEGVSDEYGDEIADTTSALADIPPELARSVLRATSNNRNYNNPDEYDEVEYYQNPGFGTGDNWFDNYGY